MGKKGEGLEVEGGERGGRGGEWFFSTQVLLGGVFLCYISGRGWEFSFWSYSTLLLDFILFF